MDKTGLIIELLENWGEVNLFTRPRRFGKSLNMNMLRLFFSYGCDPKLFDGLKITAKKELCEKYMGRFPVISITLKEVSAQDYESAFAALCSTIKNEAMRSQFLLQSDKLSTEDQERYRELLSLTPNDLKRTGQSEELVKDSLRILSLLLRRHYGQKVILIVDEYDVPLDEAQHFGYYDQMVDLIRGLFGRVLKGNDDLYFSVLTGCLRIAKESIFTGLNNFNVFSITSARSSEHFGFSDGEVKDLLHYYQLGDRYPQIKEWYDGYRFGKTNLYCPWDVLNYCAELRADPDAFPRTYWINTSGNEIIQMFLKKADPTTRQEIERLIDGETITKRVQEELTYRDLYGSLDHLWSILFTTGYLTQRRQIDGRLYDLAIPNLEIREIFKEQILEWFHEEIHKDTPKLDMFCSAFEQADAGTIERLFNSYLQKTISIRDTYTRRERKESFYHGILLGLLSHREDWTIVSNAESGDGFGDILIEIVEKRIGIVIEVKYPASGNLETGCKDALDQIKAMGYPTRLLQDGMTTIIPYGIACRKKRCLVQTGGCSHGCG